MSAPERPAGRKENVFTRKIGPLSMWVWLVIIGGAIGVWALYKNKTAGSTSATGTPASDVPQFVNQVYTNPVPPVAGGPIIRTPHPRPRKKPPTPTPTSNWPGGRQPVPTGPDVRSERLRHKGNLEQIARRNHLDVEDLIDANPELAKYKGTGKMLPVGTTIRIPPGGGDVPGSSQIAV